MAKTFASATLPLLGLAGATGAAVVLLRLADPTTPGGPIPVCPSKTLFGLCCPLCGASRMVYALSEGDLVQAAHFNALLLLFVPLMAWSAIAWAFRRSGRDLPSWERWPGALTMVISAAMIWFLLRNLPFPPFEILWV
ncbi:DUF2752 domain-containing protein [Corynebacterium pseudopelargi]|uniref:DUF2752 domain-containing protein n=1 Tax=Corynebacterium pseudopelargi TaxID=2080757 RepID=A0A3G6IYV3_9CORY|nr:DUF2752 domain-containing protein [Corynebacterium pseudopelargi]AZA09848.1 hypothetical protein CPPEL_08725 [Corynebacterium pseudopelargi]